MGIALYQMPPASAKDQGKAGASARAALSQSRKRGGTDGSRAWGTTWTMAAGFL